MEGTAQEGRVLKHARRRGRNERVMIKKEESSRRRSNLCDKITATKHGHIRVPKTTKVAQKRERKIYIKGEKKLRAQPEKAGCSMEVSVRSDARLRMQ